MTIEEKRDALNRFCSNPDHSCEHCQFKNKKCYFESFTDDEINNAYALAFPDTTPHIKDSGERRQFYDADGNPMAVRDIQEGKGRCDLMPLDVVAGYLSNGVIKYIGEFQQSGDVTYLHGALGMYEGGDPYTVILEVSKHFEEGAKKYGEWNWQKGIPVKCYIDSAVRHYLKYLRGDDDEPHDRAFVWNILCCIWTCKHKPELNDYAKEETT